MPTVLFTSATAREMQAKSIAARKANTPQAGEPSPMVDPASQDPWIVSQVTTARAVCTKIGEQALATKDPKAIEALGRAGVAWSEIERKASGRPDPGSYKPQAPPSKRGDRLEDD